MLKILFRYLPSQIIPALVTLILIGINSQYLGAEKYGVLIIAIVMVELICLLSHQWLKVSYIRYFAEFTGEKHEVFKSTADIMFCIFLTLFVTIFNALNYCIDSKYSEIIYFAIGLYFSKTAYQYFLDKIRMEELYFLYNLSTVAFSLLSVVFTLGLYFFFEATVEYSLVALGFSYLIATSLMFRKSHFRCDSFSKELAKTYFLYGFPLTISAVLMQLLSKIDRYFIAHFLGAAAVGYYSAIIGLVYGLLSLVFTIVAAPLYPEIIKKSKLGMEELNHSLKSYINLLSLIVIPATVGFYAVSSEISLLVLGDEYEAVAMTLVPFMILASLLHNLNSHLFVYGIIISKKTYRSTICSLASLACLITLSCILIPIFGLLGASLSSIFSLFLSSILMIIYSKKYLKFYLSGNIFIILSCSILMYVCILLFRDVFEVDSLIWTVVSEVLFGIGVFVPLVLLIGGGFNNFKKEYF